MSFQRTPHKASTKPKINSIFKQLWSMHWVMAGCYLLLFVSGTLMVRLSEDTPLQDNFYTFHKSMGALTMALLTWRIFILQQIWWRKYTYRIPKFTEAWIRTFLLHTAIYVFMVAVPVSGFFLSNSHESRNVLFFWLMTLPDIFPKNSAVMELARNLHFWISYTFLGFIVLHAVDQRKYVQSLWKLASNILSKAKTP